MCPAEDICESRNMDASPNSTTDNIFAETRHAMLDAREEHRLDTLLAAAIAKHGRRFVYARCRSAATAGRSSLMDLAVEAHNRAAIVALVRHGWRH